MRKTYKMKDLDCASCAAKMENAIKKIDGVQSVSISFMMQRLTVEADGERLSEIMNEAQRVCKKIEPDCTILL